MSRETDEFYRRGVEDGFRKGYRLAIQEIQDRINSGQAYDRNKRMVDREIHHMKDITFNEGIMGYRYSKRRIKYENPELLGDEGWKTTTKSKLK